MILFRRCLCSRGCVHPEALEKNDEHAVAAAASWREAMKASEAAGSGGGGSGGKRGQEQAAKELPEFDQWTVKRARNFMPQTPGALLWLESRSGRLRGSYMVADKSTSFSLPVVGNGFDAFCGVMKWVWAEHTKQTGELPAHKQLR